LENLKSVKTSGYYYRPYRKGDIYQIALATYEQKYVDFFGYEGLEERFLPNWAFTVIKDNNVVGCGGIYIYWEGVAEVWLFLSTHFKLNYIRPVIMIKHLLDELVKENNLIRLQASISAELTTNIRFIEWLGFKREGLQEKFGPWHDDHILYARII
jgi:RimJ/RimL family protein N-acetyltransferase